MIGLISQIINSSLVNQISRGLYVVIWVKLSLLGHLCAKLDPSPPRRMGRGTIFPCIFYPILRNWIQFHDNHIIHIHLCIFHSSSLIPFVEIYQCCPSVTHLHWYMMFSRSLCLSIYTPPDRYMSSENPILDWMIFSASKLFSFQLLQPILPL